MDAASKYLARLYENAVDRGLDLTAIRHYLASHGIARTPAQVEHDLDTVFSFEGYTTNHPAPEVLSLTQIDCQFGY
jgi:hypothetical protein